jgi:hypothetical protein
VREVSVHSRACCCPRDRRADALPEGEPGLVDVRDVPTDAIGKAIGERIYDLAANDGFVSV